MIYHTLVTALQAIRDAVSGASLAGPLINLGAVGVCLVSLAIYHLWKDKRYEKRIDEMREMEKAFRAEQATLQEKFRGEQAHLIEKCRQAMEKMSTALDSAIGVVRDLREGR